MTMDPMRRSERAVQTPADMATIIRAVNICRVGFVADGEPYVLPMSFGWEPLTEADGGRYWFHSATAGRKVGLLADEPRVCVQLESDVGLVTHPEKACAWTLAYRSVMAWGTARTARNHDESRHGLDVLMRHHAGRDGWSYPDKMLDHTLVWSVTVDRWTAKEHRAKDDPDA